LRQTRPDRVDAVPLQSVHTSTAYSLVDGDERRVEALVDVGFAIDDAAVVHDLDGAVVVAFVRDGALTVLRVDPSGQLDRLVVGPAASLSAVPDRQRGGVILLFQDPSGWRLERLVRRDTL